MFFRLALALALAACAGCAPRTTVYHFRAPLVSSVRAAPLPAPRPATPAPPSQISKPAHIQSLPAPHRSAPSLDLQKPAPAAVSRLQVPLPRHAPKHDPKHNHVDDSALKSESKEPALLEQGIAERLRSLVGQREKDSTHLEVALAALAAIGVELDAEVAQMSSGSALVDLAEQRQALSEELPLTGDLVVFDRVTEDEPASLVAVVVTTHGRSVGGRDVRTIEIIYLGHDVIRRGFVTPAVPTRQRDDAGRILNTFLHHATQRPATEHSFLAAELFRAVVRADRLTRLTQ